MVERVVAGTGGGIGRRKLRPGVGEARIIGAQRDVARPIVDIHRLEQLDRRAQQMPFALIGDRIHHRPHLGEGDVPVGGRDRRLEAHELAHGMAGGEAVEQVVLLRLGVERLRPQRDAVVIAQRQIIDIALVHPADRAEHRQRVALLPAFEGRLGEVFALGDRGARILFGLLDDAEQLDPLPVERADVDANLDIFRARGVVINGVAKIDDVRDRCHVRAVAAPAMVGRLECGAGEARDDSERRRHIGGELEVQHLLDEDREDDVERLLIAVGRPRRSLGAGPEPAGIEIRVAARDRVHALDRIEARHVERDGEELDVDRGLGDGADRGDIGLAFGGRPDGLGPCAHGPGHESSPPGAARHPPAHCGRRRSSLKPDHGPHGAPPLGSEGYCSPGSSQSAISEEVRGPVPV